MADGRPHPHHIPLVDQLDLGCVGRVRARRAPTDPCTARCPERRPDQKLIRGRRSRREILLAGQAVAAACPSPPARSGRCPRASPVGFASLPTEARMRPSATIPPSSGPLVGLVGEPGEDPERVTVDLEQLSGDRVDPRERLEQLVVWRGRGLPTTGRRRRTRPERSARAARPAWSSSNVSRGYSARWSSSLARARISAARPAIASEPARLGDGVVGRIHRMAVLRSCPSTAVVSVGPDRGPWRTRWLWVAQLGFSAHERVTAHVGAEAARRSRAPECLGEAAERGGERRRSRRRDSWTPSACAARRELGDLVAVAE